MRDIHVPDANTTQVKCLLAAHIIRVLDKRRLTVRSAGAMTGTAAADFSRIRQEKLDRFTVDRLIGILNRLDQQVDIALNVRPRRGPRA